MTREEELRKTAEISLREAPHSLDIKTVPFVVRDGKVFHPNLNENGTLKTKRK